jgi:trigger factor
MKNELVDVSPTRKTLIVEIPSETVDREIARVAREYSRAVRVDGFRPGKVPPEIVRRRFRDQILHEVVHELVPRAVEEALKAHALEPVDTPDIRDVEIEEGRPLRFTAAFDTVPPVDPGDYQALTLRRPPVVLEAGAVERALERLRERAARYEPVEGRGVARGDTVEVDLERRPVGPDGRPSGKAERHAQVTIDVGAPANPPGFDEELLELPAGATKQFRLAYPADYPVRELAGSSVDYLVTVRAIRRRVVPPLDDELARDLGMADLAALRARVEADLRAEAERDAERELRRELLRQLAARVPFDPPESLVAREVDRRVEDFARQLAAEGIDPKAVQVDWEEFRAHQRQAAAEAVKAALVLDEVARREGIVVTEAEVEAELARHAERTGRTPAAVRARVAQEGGLGRLYAGLRREKTVAFLLGRATILSA